MSLLRKILPLLLATSISCQKDSLHSPEILSVASAFQNHMVLQREVPIPIYGKSKPLTMVDVKIGEEIYSTITDKNGEWRILTDSHLPGGPFEIQVQTEYNKVVLSDIYFGDVWLCSGQSNMKMRLAKTENATEEIQQANYPQLRHFEAKGFGSNEPATDWPIGHWEVCTPQTAGDFTGAGYYFFKHLNPEIGVPIGLLNATWSGNRIEEWMSKESFGPDVPASPTSLDWDSEWSVENNTSQYFNRYIHPMTDMPIKGILWYQGESNAKLEDAIKYELQFKALINDWRHRWGEPELPWIFVQLASWEPNNGVNRWPELRASQTNALELPQTAMVITYDISEGDDIHPKNKNELGYRLALAARKIAYGHNVVASGPILDAAVLNGSIVLKFKSIGSGLSTPPTGTELKGFEVAGPDGQFYPAEAIIVNEEVHVSWSLIGDVSAIRYAWSNAPSEANLFNLEGLPALPFLYEF